MTDRLRALTGVKPMKNPAADVPPDEEPGTSERVPPDRAGDPVQPPNEATGDWHADKRDAVAEERSNEQMGERHGGG